MSRRRTRMISFRVSHSEFELLKSKSESEGGRGISEYAREALCRSNREPYDRVDPSIHQLSDEIRQLREHLLHIIEFLAISRRTAVRPPLAPASRPDGRALQLATRKSGRA